MAGEFKNPSGRQKKEADASKFKDLGLILALLVANILLVFRFFSVDFSYVFSAPVIPILAQGLSALGMDYGLSVRAVLLLAFSLGPVSVYFFVSELTGRTLSALIAAVLFSLPLFRSRFEALVISGDGAHIAALSLVPLAAFWLMRFLKEGSYVSGVAASIAVLLVALTSPFGLFVLLGVMLVITFSEMLLGQGRLKFFRFLMVIFFSSGLAAFWYNPEFVRLSVESAPGRAVIAAVKNLIPLSFFILPVLGTFGFLIFDKRPHLQPLFISLGLTIIFGLISFAGGLAKFAVSAQSRYLPELTMSLAILWGVVGAYAYDLVGYLPRQRWFPVPKRKRPFLQKLLLGAFLIFSLVLAVAFPYREAVSGRSGRLVAGVTDSVVIDIGEIRERTGGMHKAVGYLITGLTVLLMAGVYKLLKQEQARSQS